MQYVHQPIFTWPNEVDGIPRVQSHDFDGVQLNGDGSVVLGGCCYAKDQAIAGTFNGIKASREQGSPTVTLLTPVGQTFLLNFYSRRFLGIQITGVWSRLVPCKVPVTAQSESAAGLITWTLRKLLQSLLLLVPFLIFSHCFGLAAMIALQPNVPKNSAGIFIGAQCYGLPLVLTLLFVARVLTHSVDEHWRVMSWSGLAYGAARTAIDLILVGLAFIALPGAIQTESSRLLCECWSVVPSRVESAAAKCMNTWRRIDNTTGEIK